jgi:hypothetical protein
MKTLPAEISTQPTRHDDAIRWGLFGLRLLHLYFCGWFLHFLFRFEEIQPARRIDCCCDPGWR